MNEDEKYLSEKTAGVKMATFDLKTCDERKISFAESSITQAEVILSPCEFPEGKSVLSSQVAGHQYSKKKKAIGMLRGPNGRVFKPIEKPHLGERETNFYENLQTSTDPTDVDLLRYTPTYYGLTEMQIFSKHVKLLELEDITEGMSEPCVMDVKIGKRTWDPSAGPEKRAAEEAKYAASKEAYGFCIAGFQVYRLPGENLRKYGKDYGKQLDAQGVAGAIEKFLNAVPGSPPHRDLVIRLLSILWKILSFIRTQRKYRFYSSSLLIAYDAKRLRHSIRAGNLDATRNASHSNTLSGASQSIGCLTQIGQPSQSPRSTSPKVQSPESSKQENSFRFPKNRTIDRLQRLKRSISLTSCEAPEEPSSPGDDPESRKPPDFTVHKLCRTHSYSNNFDDDMIEIKEDYAALLSELSSTCEEKQNWVRVFMIDFTHVFPADDDNVDVNYLNGIENLIKMLEGFLT